MAERTVILIDSDGNPVGVSGNPLIAVASGDVGGGVPDGGTTGQVLQKKTDADQDTEWGDGSGGGTGISWNEVTGTTQTAAADNGYIANNESLVTVTLPETCAVGKVVHVAGKGSGLWKIAQNESQIIYFGDQNSTSGTAGYIAARYQYDAVELLCITADTTFLVIGNVGNLDVI